MNLLLIQLSIVGGSILWVDEIRLMLLSILPTYKYKLLEHTNLKTFEGKHYKVKSDERNWVYKLMNRKPIDCTLCVSFWSSVVVACSMLGVLTFVEFIYIITVTPLMLRVVEARL